MPIARSEAAVARHFYTAWEARTILSFKVDEAVLAPLLPGGWRVVPFEDGAARGANVRMGLTDQLVVRNADGSSDASVLSPPRFVPQTISAIHERLERPVLLVAGGLSTLPIAPLFAHPRPGEPAAPRTPDVASVTRASRIDASGAAMIEESWHMSSPTGDRLVLELSCRRGAPTRIEEELFIYPPSPELDRFRRYRIEKIEDVIYSGPLGIDRREAYRFEIAGRRLPAVVEGRADLVSIALQPHGRREVYLP